MLFFPLTSEELLNVVFDQTHSIRELVNISGRVVLG